jgi:hypothetical protein
MDLMEEIMLTLVDLAVVVVMLALILMAGQEHLVKVMLVVMEHTVVAMDIQQVVAVALVLLAQTEMV